MYCIRKHKVWIKPNDSRYGMYLPYHGCYTEEFNMAHFRELEIVREFGFSDSFVTRVGNRKRLQDFMKYRMPPIRSNE